MSGLFLRVAGSLVRAWHSIVGGLRSRVFFLQPHGRRATSPESETPLLHRSAGGAVATGCLFGSRLALDRASSYPLISRGLPGLLRLRREITGRVCARRARMSRSRDRESRATETRVRPVPAVAMRGRCVSVADDTAERPVHARTRSRAARKTRGRRASWRARGRMIGSTMVSHRRRQDQKRQIAPPTLQANRRDSPAAERMRLRWLHRASGRDSLHES